MRSPLLRLPGEIRNRIYEYAFCGEVHTENALIKTCKQIEHESKPVYYSHITLEFHEFGEIRHLVKRTTPELLARVESIRTSAKKMGWRILLGEDTDDENNDNEYTSYTRWLTGLKHWHLYGYVDSVWRLDIRRGIRRFMGRDVEVTFEPM